MKLHLGCWHRYLPGFIHVDLCDLPHIDHNHTVAELPMFEDDSVELIYASHVLEYFDRTEVKSVLAEWYRVLEHGGILRIAVPNLLSLLEIYSLTGDIKKILGPLYGRMVAGDSVIYHRTVYDLISLEEVLTEAGFGDIREWDWRAVFHKDYDDHSQAYFPHMDKENGIHVSLNVEVTKP